jgi:hypothetical protein
MTEVPEYAGAISATEPDIQWNFKTTPQVVSHAFLSTLTI